VWARRPLSVLPERIETYAAALSQPPPYRRWRAEPAAEGVHLFRRRNGSTASVRIPAVLANLPRPVGHDLTGRSKRVPVAVPWQALVVTACWMNKREREITGNDNNWVGRLKDVRLELRAHDGAFARAEVLTIDSILHLVGTVSSGKSTLLDVLAVWAAHKGLHVALVVGDVRSVLRNVEHLTSLGIEAAPVLGSTNLSTHVERQHRQEHGKGRLSVLEHADPAFDYLSSACLLDGLRSAPRPFGIREAPCTGLHPLISKSPVRPIAMMARKIVANRELNELIHTAPLFARHPFKLLKLVVGKLDLSLHGCLSPSLYNRTPLARWRTSWLRSVLGPNTPVGEAPHSGPPPLSVHRRESQRILHTTPSHALSSEWAPLSRRWGRHSLLNWSALDLLPRNHIGWVLLVLLDPTGKLHAPCVWQRQRAGFQAVPQRVKQLRLFGGREVVDLIAEVGH